MIDGTKMAKRLGNVYDGEGLAGDAASRPAAVRHFVFSNALPQGDESVSEEGSRRRWRRCAGSANSPTG